MKPTLLVYVFKVSFRSAANDDSYVPRLTVLQSTECKSTPAQMAGNIAAHHLKVYESGVRVEFLGLQEDRTKGGKKPQLSALPITQCNPFTLTLRRS
mgnify:CR=1